VIPTTLRPAAPAIGALNCATASGWCRGAACRCVIAMFAAAALMCIVISHIYVWLRYF
jgi:hypothetical protein